MSLATVERSPGDAQARIPDEPLFTAEVEIPAFEVRGWVSIHSLGARGACGGIRLYPDVERREVEALARAMTYKYAFFEKEMGGAKAGFRLPFGWPPERRRGALREIGAHIAPLVRANVYNPWTDMNCSRDDLREIMAGAGIGIPEVGDSAYTTALSTFAGVMACAAHAQIGARDLRVTIEGLGNVGTCLATELVARGAKVVGLSNRVGAVADPAGLDVAAIARAREAHGDAWVDEPGPWTRVDREQVPALAADVHVPCARTEAITSERAARIGAPYVVPAANVPCTEGGVLELERRGIRLLPDFVINGGGIVGTGLGELASSDEAIRAVFFGEFQQMIRRLLRLAEHTQRTPVDLARDEAHRNYEALVRSARRVPKLPQKVYHALAWRGLVPRRQLRRRSAEHLLRVLNERFAERQGNA